MSIDLTGIHNQNEYYTNHYFATVFEENEKDTLSKWRENAKSSEERTPWSLLRDAARQYGVAHERYLRSNFDLQTLQNIRDLADRYLAALGYPAANPGVIAVDDETSVPVYLEVKKNNGAPALWVLLGASPEQEANVLEKNTFNGGLLDTADSLSVPKDFLSTMRNEDLATKILFSMDESPRFLIFIGMNQIVLIDRNKWNEKRYLQFNLDEIFGRREETTLQAMSVLLHRESLCPKNGKVLLDEFDESSQRNASGVSRDLKYALRESIELLGNEVLYDMKTRQGRNFAEDPVDAGELTLQCLRYMYRMLFVLFIESRQDLGYAPMKSQVYFSAYSLESLRDIAEQARDDVEEIGDGYYLFETLEKLYSLIYTGYPITEEGQQAYDAEQSHHDDFRIPPLKAHIFDPERTSMITNAKIRNHVMLRIIDLMSVTRGNGKSDSRGRISYSNLGINQMGAVYEALLSYRGFIAEQDLYEVKPAGRKFDELEVGYFVPESDLDQYTEEERVYTKDDGGHKVLRMYQKGTFIYRLAGREREKSASYYTPEVLTKCLVKYALKELLKDKTADEILELNICEPAMGSAAFLNETINQLAEAYLERKQKELGESISYDDRQNQLQKVKMYIADRNIYGIDLNPVAVELAEVSLWLNTIYEGGFVPWFGTQLVNGNSLIGARRQCYTVAQLKTSSKGMHWYENAPERVPLGTERHDKGYRNDSRQIYHFLLGDPGMSEYKDKVIKQLKPDKIKAIDKWRKEFTKPYNDNEILSLLELSRTIDKLWDEQVQLRKEIDERTQDHLSVYGHEDTGKDSHTTIREKDRIYSELYKSEHMRNAGPYARLKFAMDYWCALWFWPIDQTELLPSRSEYIFDLDVILNGTRRTDTRKRKDIFGQEELFPSAQDNILQEWINFAKESGAGEVDIPALCAKSPRLALVKKIAEQNHFMHWELEFADLFAEKGGFDLVIGNPPWILLGWNEKVLLSENHPLIAIRNINATQIANLRNSALDDFDTLQSYLAEYVNISGEQNYLNALQNYEILRGMKANLYKCFLPQAWYVDNKNGVSAFLHPEGVYDDPRGGALREKVYARLRKHFMFANERKLFSEVDHHTRFSLNVYGDPRTTSFDSISNLYDAETIEECYNGNPAEIVPGIKTEDGSWNTKGHPDRIINITKEELKVFAKLFDPDELWSRAKLPALHVKQQLEVLRVFANNCQTLGQYQSPFYTTTMWNETNAQNDGTYEAKIDFPENPQEVFFVGASCNNLNPFFQTVRRVYKVNSDYDCIDLTEIDENYCPRYKYRIACGTDEFNKRIPETPWKAKCNDDYMLVNREFVGSMSERTLVSCILPPKSSFLYTLFGVAMPDLHQMVCLCACENSLSYDFLIKIIGKNHINYGVNMSLPLIPPKGHEQLMVRALLMNCLTRQYADLWKSCWNESYRQDSWSKNDPRLRSERFTSITQEWNWSTPLRTDYERRQALVEIDVLTSMTLGMTLKQLKTIYRIQFPVLQSYEADTWYDTNGRITFTNNRSLTNVGFTRPEWENPYAVEPVRRGVGKWNGVMKNAPEGYVFARTITDDTMPGGPIERTIEYVAPFDRCDREKDYETAWAFFEKKYGGTK